MDVDIDESCHQELAVKSVHDASVTRDDVTEVLDFKCSLESRGKEASEGADDGGEQRHEEAVDEEGVEGDGLLHVEEPPPGGDGLGEGVLGGPEEGAGLAAHGHPLQLGAVLDGADEVGVLARHVGQPQAHEDRGHAAADEALPGLLGAELDERGPAHEEAEEVRHDVVDDHHHDGHDEPNETLQIMNNQGTAILLLVSPGTCSV